MYVQYSELVNPTPEIADRGYVILKDIVPLVEKARSVLAALV